MDDDFGLIFIKVCTYLPFEVKAGYQHQLSIWQMEVSRTQVFRDPEHGRALVENLIRENLDVDHPDRVSLTTKERKFKEPKITGIRYSLTVSRRIR